MKLDGVSLSETLGTGRVRCSAHALPEGSALGGLLDCQADAEGADGGEDSSVRDTPPGSSEVPRFDRKVMV